MIYTTLTNKAIKLAYEAHHGQVDKAGIPYVFHPFHLAEQMSTEFSTAVALLHDVVEDTHITLEDLKEAGFPEEVVEAVRLLTHEEGVDYFDYVRKIKPNSIAREVKVADLRHNSDTSRFEMSPAEVAKRSEKYKKAMEILES